MLKCSYISSSILIYTLFHTVLRVAYENKWAPVETVLDSPV